MPELVCYVTIDDIYKGEKSYVYKDIDEKCLSQKSKRIGGDGPSEEKSGLVVGFNDYDKLVYKMHVENLEPGQYSECDGPDATRGMFHYYETSEEILESCNHTHYDTVKIIGQVFSIGVVIAGAAAFEINVAPHANLNGGFHYILANTL